LRKVKKRIKRGFNKQNFVEDGPRGGSIGSSE
jgi:hypothetical protein